MKPQIPRSYEEITRKTVLEPDGSIRAAPSRPSDLRVESEVRAAIADALLAAGLTEVGIEVEDGKILLRGWVSDASHASRALRIVHNAAPDLEIKNQMHVGDS